MLSVKEFYNRTLEKRKEAENNYQDKLFIFCYSICSEDGIELKKENIKGDINISMSRYWDIDTCITTCYIPLVGISEVLCIDIHSQGRLDLDSRDNITKTFIHFTGIK